MPHEPEQFYSGAEFQRFFRQSPQSLVIKANPPYFTMVAVSDRFLELTQLNRPDILGHNLFDVFPDNKSDPSGKLSAYKAFMQVIATQQKVDLPVYRYDIFVPSAGKELPFYWSNSNEPVLSEDGKTVQFIINTTANITEQIILEQKELEARTNAALAQQRVNTIFMKAPIGMVLLTRDNYVIEYANEMVLRMWNKGSAEQVLGRSVFDVIRELEANGLRPIYDSVVNSSRAFFETEVPVTYDRDGAVQTYFFDIHIEPVQDLNNEVTGLMILTHDVTESLATRRQIAASEERLRMASEATGLGSFDVDLETWSIVHSPELSMIFGLPKSTDLSWDQFVNAIHPDDLMIRDLAYKRALVNGIYSYEARVVWPDQTVRWIRARGKFLFDSEKKPIRIIGTAIDITEEKQLEIRKNDFLAIASHELKTPLTSLKLMIEILSGSIAGKTPAMQPELLTRANRQINRMTDLIHDFLDLSRIESGKLSLTKGICNINDLIGKTLEEHHFLIGTGTIRFTPGEIPDLYIDAEKISQVLDNLLTNAIKYSGQNPRINIGTTANDTEVIISVSDEGIGIEESHQPKIFERFYRVDDQSTKLFSGFGIGLYLAADIVQRHQGNIWVESKKGKGSTFYFSLPLTLSEPATS